MNAIFIVLDSFRYDAVQNPQAFQYLFPNLASISSGGTVQRVVANAQSTQFVLPSLFTLSYPLDFGGYNNGIRDRPKSFVEVLRENGYLTGLYATANQIGLGNGYQRGFDLIGTTSDYRTQLEHKISRVLSYHLERWKKGELDETSILEILKSDFGGLLENLVESMNAHDKSIWPEKLFKLNQRVAEGCRGELKLLSEKPTAVLWKLTNIAAGVYWQFLGVEKPRSRSIFFSRLRTSVNWRARELLQKQEVFPFLPLSHCQVLGGEIIGRLCQLIDSWSEKKWFLYLHFMDIHDCRSMNRPLHVLYKTKFFWKWMRARKLGFTKRRFVYDSTAMYMDECLGRLFRHLEKKGWIGDTLILITADHAYQYAESPREKTPVGERMHYEDIDVPLIMRPVARGGLQQEGGLLDSRAVTAGFLQALGLPLYEKFSCASLFNGGLPAVVSESCGSGAADLAERDIFFAVTGREYKIFAILSGKNLRITQLYCLREDPCELKNLIAEKNFRSKAQELAKYLYSERMHLFQLRGISSSDEFIVG